MCYSSTCNFDSRFIFVATKQIKYTNSWWKIDGWVDVGGGFGGGTTLSLKTIDLRIHCCVAAGIDVNVNRTERKRVLREICGRESSWRLSSFAGQFTTTSINLPSILFHRFQGKPQWNLKTQFFSGVTLKHILWMASHTDNLFSNKFLSKNALLSHTRRICVIGKRFFATYIQKKREFYKWINFDISINCTFLHSLTKQKSYARHIKEGFQIVDSVF
jgi:hypothetical protein